MDVEQRARELLADEFARMGGLSDKYVEEVRNGIFGPWDRTAIRAIIAALTPPEGYVLVPVEPTEAMLEAGGDVEQIHIEWGVDPYVENTADVWRAMLSARPEVKP